MGFAYERLIDRLVEDDEQQRTLASALRLRKFALRWFARTALPRAAYYVGAAELEFAGRSGGDGLPDAEPERWLRRAIREREHVDTWWWAWYDLARLALQQGNPRRAASLLRPLTSRCAHPLSLTAWDLRLACLLEGECEAESARVADRLVEVLGEGRIESMALVECVPGVEALARRDDGWERRRQALWQAIGW